MNRRTAIRRLATFFLTTASLAQAQQPKKVPQIGYLSSSDPTTDFIRAEMIRQGLRERGYIEGQNIAIEYRYAEGKPGRYPELADEVVRLKVDIIVVSGGTPMVRAAMNATKTIPIVMTGQGIDAVEAGFVESLARPGGIVTGITAFSRGGLAGKRLELLKEAVPKSARIAVLYDPVAPSGALFVKEILPEVARALKLTIQPWEVRRAEDFDKVFSAMRKQRSDGLYVAGGPRMYANGKRIASFALKNRLPSVYGRGEDVEVGGLMYYGVDERDHFRRVGYFVDRILKGAKPAELPVEQPMRFEFVINLQTANKIGLTIPPDLLARATKIIR
jgi:putative ABC transport system substrate-binding protein